MSMVKESVVKVALAMALLALIVAVGILVVAGKAQAAGTGMPMMKGLKSPTELAALVERSFKSDSTGKKLLDPARCKKDGSCATAHDYFQGIQRAHPSAKLGNIAELPRYLRSLVKQPAPTGEWYMSRMLVRGEKHTYDHAGWHRAFFKGEVVWDDPNTGEHILAGDCGNIVAPRSVKPEAPVVPPPPEVCPKIRVTVKPGDTALQFILLGGVPLMSASCPFGYKPPADNKLYVLPTECPHAPCDFVETIRASGLASGPSGGIDVSQKLGVYTFQVSKEFAEDGKRIAAFCVTTASGAHSCAKDIRPPDYNHGVAVVGYADSDKPVNWAGTIRIWCFPTSGPCGECR